MPGSPYKKKWEPERFHNQHAVAQMLWCPFSFLSRINFRYSVAGFGALLLEWFQLFKLFYGFWMIFALSAIVFFKRITLSAICILLRHSFSKKKLFHILFLVFD
jgi:hypothetical protein